MKIEAILALLRHGLTTGGGLLVSSGFATEDEITGGAGAIVFLAGMGWSWYRKWARAERDIL